MVRIIISILFLVLISCLMAGLYFAQNHHNAVIHSIKRNNDEATIVKEVPVSDTKEVCQFGFGFLNEIKKKSPNYIKRLLPEHKKQNFSGALVSQDLMCLDTIDAAENQWVGIYECHGQGRNQAVKLTTSGLMLTGSNKPLCIAMKNMVSTGVVLKKCSTSDETQLWTTDSLNGHVKPVARQNHCLKAPSDENEAVVIDLCSEDVNTQRWQLVMQEVLSLWLSVLPREDINRAQKEKGTKKQMDKLILQKSKPTEKQQTFIDPLFM